MQKDGKVKEMFVLKHFFQVLRNILDKYKLLNENSLSSRLLLRLWRNAQNFINTLYPLSDIY